MNQVQKISDNAMQIVKLPQVPQGGSQFKADKNLYGLYDSNGGYPLGIVKRNFNLIQPGAVIDEVSRCLGELNGIDLSKLQYDVMRDGARHRLTVLVKEFGFKLSQAKLNDVTAISLDIRWGYDGWTPFEMNLFTRRLVCLNGMTAPGKGAKVRFKNYSDSGQKLSFACEQFAEVIAKAEDYQVLAQSLDKLAVTDEDIVAVLARVNGTDPKATARLWTGKSVDRAEISDAKQATMAEIIDSIRTEFKRTGYSGWGLLNGFTHFTNHKAPFRTANVQSEIEDRVDYLTYGGGADINAKAVKAVQELFTA